MAKRTSADQSKPAKPSKTFPLFPHANGQWAKKIKGKLYYFGPWSDAEGAEHRYLADVTRIREGLPKVEPMDGKATLDYLVNAWLASKAAKLAAGELSAGTMAQYRRIGQGVLDRVGKNVLAESLRAADFANLLAHINRTYAPARRVTEINTVKGIFAWGFKSELLDRAVRLGPDFRTPDKKLIRKARAARSRHAWRADELRQLVDAATGQFKAMLLLACNGGYTQREVAGLRLDAVDLDAAMIDCNRAKTETPRQCPLWPETVQAIREAIKSRPTPPDGSAAEGLLFVTKYRAPWVRDDIKADGTLSHTDSVNQELVKLCRTLKLPTVGRGFGKIRHWFRTTADATLDQHATLRIMGHAVPGISEHYVLTIEPARLRKVVENVRGSLWPKGE